MVLVLSWASCE